jgi:hypothetical protein
MKKIFRKILMLAFAGLSAGAVYAQTWNIGTPVETDVTATLDANGTLTVSGTGAMKDAPFKDDTKAAIKAVVVESGVTTIGYSAFSGCANLESVVLAEGLINIGTFGFIDCPKIQTLNIPASVTKIEMDAFGACTGLTEIYVHWTNPDALNTGCCIFETVNTHEITLYVPDGTNEAYEDIETWREFYIVENGVGYSAWLKSLNIGEWKMTPGFRAEYDAYYNYEFAATVPRSVESITINAVPVGASTVSGDIPLVLDIDGVHFEHTINVKPYYQYSLKVPVNIDWDSGYENINNWTTVYKYHDVVYSLQIGDEEAVVFNKNVIGKAETLGAFTFTEVGPLTGIEALDNKDFSVYPNPAEDVLHINFPSFENLESLNAQIYDIAGRPLNISFVKKTEYLVANISSLPKGTYIVRVGNRAAKFVKK